MAAFTLVKGCLFFFFSWLCSVACGTLVPQPGIETVPPAMEAWSLNPGPAGKTKGCLDETRLQLPNGVFIFPGEAGKEMEDLQAWDAFTLSWYVPQFLVFAWGRLGPLDRLGPRASFL